MRSPWESSYRNEGDSPRGITGGFDTGGGGVEHRLLGSLIERSTSAPPMSSEGDLQFGSGTTSSLFGRDRERTMAPLYEHRSRDDTIRSVDESPSIARPHAGRASASPSAYNQHPDMSSLLPEGLEEPSRALLESSLDSSSSFSRAGAELIRSQSAAPNFHGDKRNLLPPPGLTNIKPVRPVPSSNYSGLNNNHNTSSIIMDGGRNNNNIHNNRNMNSGMMDSAVDRGADIMSLGQRRAASTGVIGNSGIYSPGAIRPSAKTFMDLIQEDMPEKPHKSPAGGEYDSYNNNNNNNRNNQYEIRDNPYNQYGRDPDYNNRGDNQYNNYRGGDYDRNNNPYAVPRARTTSPTMMGQHPGGEPQYMYAQHQLQQQQPQYDRFQQTRNAREPYEMNSPMNDPIRQGQPQYVTLAEPGFNGEPRMQGSIYAPAVQHPGSHLRSPPPPEAQQQIYYGNRQVEMGTPVLTQNGQTVYLNTPSPQYGYATVQYHPHQQPQIIRQQVPGRGHPHEQYVSVVPIQGGAQLVTGAGGQTYAYWPDGGGAPLAVPQVTIMNATGPGGAPITVARIGGPQMDIPHANGGYAGRGKEKGGKGRRGGGGGGGGASIPGRRGGAEVKHNPHSLSSPLLEEFRATKCRDWTVRDIEGHVVEFCQDQNGSRFIQQRLEIGDATEQKLVMNEVLPTIHRLRNDVFGNYVVQKLLEFGTPQMKADIRDTLTGEMLHLSLQMYGCRVVQKALEALDEDDLPRLLKEFHHNVLSCIHDQNGNHVMQKCIEVMSTRAKQAREMGDDAKADFLDEQIDFVVDDILGNTASLSCHPYGCRVLQRILEHCVEPKKNAALDEISKCHRTLLDDQYGNYVIQHVLQFGRQSDRESILGIVVENGLLSLSKQKFASNVVEKLLKYGTAQQRKAVVREMLKVVDDQTGEIKPAGETGSSVVILMVRDAYANYVVQTTLDVVPESEEKRLLLEELNSHSTELRNYTFAKHIMTKLST